MRISVWSSDVCSSDLHGKPLPYHRKLIGRKFERTIAGARPCDSRSYRESPKGRTGRREEGGEQIGRASCRERVVSVRVDLGGRRILKKNTEKIQLSMRTYATQNEKSTSRRKKT